MTNVIRIALLAIICLSGCDEGSDRSKATPETMIVKLDGVSLAPDTRMYSRTASAGILGKSLVISGAFLSDSSDIHNQVHLTITVAGLGRVEVKGNVGFLDPPGSIGFSNPGQTLRYESGAADAAVAGSITITKLDYKKNLVSGNFEAKLKKVDGPDVIDLTEGSFTELFLQHNK